MCEIDQYANEDISAGMEGNCPGKTAIPGTMLLIVPLRSIAVPSKEIVVGRVPERARTCLAETAGWKRSIGLVAVRCDRRYSKGERGHNELTKSLPCREGSFEHEDVARR